MPWKSMTAMVCIAIPLTVALVMGQNGALLASGLTLIAGIAGFSIGRVSPKK